MKRFAPPMKFLKAVSCDGVSTAFAMLFILVQSYEEFLRRPEILRLKISNLISVQQIKMLNFLICVQQIKLRNFFIKKFEKNLVVSEIMRIFAPGNCLI